MPDLTMSEWIGAGVAIGTALLAFATFGIVLEARRARLQERRQRIRASFRTAIIEQLDNARALMTADPARGSDHVGRYLFPLHLRFEAVERLLGTEPLPGDLSAYLLWSIGRSKTYGARVHDSLEEVTRAQERLADSPVRGQWATLVDEVQIIACLLIGHANRERDLALLTTEFADSPWVRPLRGSANARMLARAQDLLAPHRPPWPAGEWYERCREQARDDAAAAAAAVADADLAAHATPRTAAPNSEDPLPHEIRDRRDGPGPASLDAHHQDQDLDGPLGNPKLVGARSPHPVIVHPTP